MPDSTSSGKIPEVEELAEELYRDVLSKVIIDVDRMHNIFSGERAAASARGLSSAL